MANGYTYWEPNVKHLKQAKQVKQLKHLRQAKASEEKTVHYNDHIWRTYLRNFESRWPHFHFVRLERKLDMVLSGMT